jgi:hypothetical protein
MTIEEADKIDGLGLDCEVKEVVLLISDHLPWQGDQTHISKLEKKIGSYINFIKSGQVNEALPQGLGLSMRIKLIHEYQPGRSAEPILDAIEKQLMEIGIAFSYEPLPTGY